MEKRNTLPSPPMLKTTIIQLNKELEPSNDNYEILTNTYGNDEKEEVMDKGQVQNATKKRRRRLLVNVDKEELLKRKNATKKLHSIIEKRRRLKVNREFEALKYVIPACRNINGGKEQNKETTPPKTSGGKIDGIYKLTILKSSVEYILYLHHIVQQQHRIIQESGTKYDFDVDFTKVDLDVNKYRNIDIDFDFHEMTRASSTKESPEKSDGFLGRRKNSPLDGGKNNMGIIGDLQLLSPEVSPNIEPLLSVIVGQKENGTMKQASRSPLNSHTSVPRTMTDRDQNKFILPGPALSLTAPKCAPDEESCANNDLKEVEVYDTNVPEVNKAERTASNTLLSLRKSSSIHNLLN